MKYVLIALKKKKNPLQLELREDGQTCLLKQFNKLYSQSAVGLYNSIIFQDSQSTKHLYFLFLKKTHLSQFRRFYLYVSYLFSFMPSFLWQV